MVSVPAAAQDEQGTVHKLVVPFTHNQLQGEGAKAASR